MPTRPDTLIPMPTPAELVGRIVNDAMTVGHIRGAHGSRPMDEADANLAKQLDIRIAHDRRKLLEYLAK